MARQSASSRRWVMRTNEWRESLAGRKVGPVQPPPGAPLRHLYSAGVVFLLTSIDKTVLILLPVMAPLVAASLDLDEGDLGVVIGLNLLTVACSAVYWGYQSGKRDRRTLLVVGTLCWAVPVGLASFARSFVELLLFTLAGFGLGSVMPVGYSLIGDMMPSSRRGLLMSLWGGAQALGAGAAPVLVGLLAPTGAGLTIFALVAAVGAVLALLAAFATGAPKGSAALDLCGTGERAIEQRPTSTRQASGSCGGDEAIAG